MLENIRKYSALMIIVLVLLAFGLVVTLGNRSGQTGSTGEIITINGQGISEAQLQAQYDTLPKLVQSQNHSGAGRLAIYQYIQSLQELVFTDAEPRFSLALSQILINQEAKRLGVFISTEDAIAYIDEHLFSDGEGNRDHTLYNKFAEKDLKQLGMNEADYRAIIINMLTFEAVRDIKSPVNLPASLRVRIGDIRNQTIDATIIEFDIKEFKEGQKATEEQLKAFYDDKANRTDKRPQYVDAFWTKKQIKLTYIPVNLQGIPQLSDSVKEVDIELLKAAQERDFKTYKKFTRDDANVGESTDIVTLAKKYNLKCVTTELVSADLLKLEDHPITGDKERYGTLHQFLYEDNIRKTGKVSLYVKDAHKPSYLHYQISEEVAPQLKSYEEAKDAISKIVIEDLAIEAMVAKAEEAKAKLQAAVKEGKDLVKEIEALNLVSIEVPKLSVATKGFDLKLINPLVQASTSVNPKHFSEIVNDKNTAAFTFVKKREVEKEDGFEAMDKVKARQLSRVVSNEIALADWASKTYEQAKENGQVVYPGINDKK